MTRKQATAKALETTGLTNEASRDYSLPNVAPDTERPAAPPPEPPAPKLKKLTALGLDLSKPIDLTLVRTAELTLDHQNAAKAIVVGRSIANNANTDGVCVRLQYFGAFQCVLATIRKQSRTGDKVSSSDRFLIIQGDLECEVMTDLEKVKHGIDKMEAQ